MDFYDTNFSRRIHPCHPTLGDTGPTLGDIGPTLGRLWADFGPTWGRTWADSGPIQNHSVETLNYQLSTGNKIDVAISCLREVWCSRSTRRALPLPQVGRVGA